MHFIKITKNVVFALLIGIGNSYAQTPPRINKEDIIKNTKDLIIIPNPKQMADNIENAIKDKCMGYQFAIYYKGELSVFRFGGTARTNADVSPHPMLFTDQFNIASVSKTVTAVAIMQLVNQNKLSLDEPMYKYLPQHWVFGENVKGVTIRDLLSHHSGLAPKEGNGYSVYQELKYYVSQTANPQKGYAYKNTNYGLLKFIVAKVAGYPVRDFNKGVWSMPDFEKIDADENANFYKDYCKKNIFDKLGLFQIGDQPVEPQKQGLTYHFPALGEKGNDKFFTGNAYMDAQLGNGSTGWNMSANQMGIFFSALMYTDKLVPHTLAKQMADENLGFVEDLKGKTPKGLSYYAKSGFYPGDDTNGELNVIIVGYGNDIQLSIIYNSQLVLPDKKSFWGDILPNAVDESVLITKKH